MTKAAKTILLFGLMSLSGCISGVKETDTYTDRNGKTTIIETDREACTRSCNEDFSRCMDTEPAQTNGGLHDAPNTFGARGDCHDNLKDCLSGCNTQ
jgi:hypothetical protein